MRAAENQRRERMVREGWSLAVVLTDVPLRIGRRPSTASVREASPRGGVMSVRVTIEAARDRVDGPEVFADVPGGPLMVAAYALIWLAVLGYVFRLVRLQRGVDENLARLQQDLQKAAQRSAPK